MSDDRPGWGGFDYVPDERTGSLNDLVEAAMDGTNLGVRGHRDRWQVVSIDEDEVVTVEEKIYSTAEKAMLEVERRVKTSE